MTEFLQSAGMMPHGYCLLWKGWLVALHAGSDVVIFVSYFLIPLAIVRFLRARPDVRLGGLEWLFAGFILLCGLTHLFGLITLWYPVYELQGMVKMITALVSAITASMIFALLPRLIALPSPAQLQAANDELKAEIERHRQTLAELNDVRARLESEVESRTRELTDTNDRLKLVTRETVHRSKNLLTVVQSIARQSAAFTNTKEELLEALSGRMSSLAKALASVLESSALGADFSSVLGTQLAHYRDSYPGRIVLSGPSMQIRAEAAQQIGLAVHELATNAVKYGALSRPGGQVEIRWERRGERKDAVVELTWVETLPEGVEGRKAGDGQGFGSMLLKRAVPMQLRAKVRSDFTETGYRYSLSIPAATLVPRGQTDPDDEVARAFPVSPQSSAS